MHGDDRALSAPMTNDDACRATKRVVWHCGVMSTLSARICLFAQRCGPSLSCAPSCAIVVLKACGFEFSDEASVVILDFLVAAHVHAV
jgi:hypothetical protein